MFTIQLFILDNDGSHKRVDMFKDESVSITQTIQNVKDISKVFTDFTKTFNLPASSTNNKLFKHYYNSDIVDADNNLISDFDARKRRDAIIELNHMPLGFIHVRTREDSISGEISGTIPLLAVSPESQGLGLGKLLIKHGENWAKDLGCRLLHLEVFANNKKADAFYQNIGFQPETVHMIKPI